MPNQPAKETEMTAFDQVRQGDVPLVEVKALPDGARPVPRDEHGRIVLAHGERTGHAHVVHEFVPDSTCGFSTLDSGEIEYLVVGGGGASLRHELLGGKKAEHDEIALKETIYEIPVQVEYTPAELVRVAD